MKEVQKRLIFNSMDEISDDCLKSERLVRFENKFDIGDYCRCCCKKNAVEDWIIEGANDIDSSDIRDHGRGHCSALIQRCCEERRKGRKEKKNAGSWPSHRKVNVIGVIGCVVFAAHCSRLPSFLMLYTVLGPYAEIMSFGVSVRLKASGLAN